MLTVCSSAEILVKDEELAAKLYEAADVLGISANVKIAKKLSGDADVVIADASYARKNDIAGNVVVVLGDGKVAGLTEKYSRFIFNKDDKREQFFAFYVADDQLLEGAVTVEGDLYAYGASIKGGKVFFNGEELYLTKKQREYVVARMLGENDRSRRYILCRLRKKFGEDFLRSNEQCSEQKT